MLLGYRTKMRFWCRGGYVPVSGEKCFQHLEYGGCSVCWQRSVASGANTWDNDLGGW